MPTIAVENYVKQIFLLQSEERTDYVPMGHIAQALDVVPGTATTMVKSLADNGLARYQPRIGVRLTEEGEVLAKQMLRKHRLVEVFLVEVLGFDWAEIHEDAEMLEHALSDRVLARIDELCGFPRFDPHGDPIPEADGTYRPRKLENLMQCGINKEVEVAQVRHQETDFLQFLEEAGLRLGTRVKVADRSDLAETVTLEIKDARPISLGASVAEKILVI